MAIAKETVVKPTTEGTNTAPKAEVATVNNQVVATPAQTTSYVAQIMKAEQEAFKAVNADMDFDFVRMGESLKMNKKGVFVLRNDETVEFGDTLDVVIAKGETRYMLWGVKGSPEDGQIIVAEKTQEEAAQKLTEYFEAVPGASERYSIVDIKINYAAYTVLVDSIKEDPAIYILFFPQTGAYSFGQYASRLFKGDKSKSIPKHTGINAVITRITNKEEKGSGSDTYLAYVFEAVAMFNPADFGIEA